MITRGVLVLPLGSWAEMKNSRDIKAGRFGEMPLFCSAHLLPTDPGSRVNGGRKADG